MASAANRIPFSPLREQNISSIPDTLSLTMSAKESIQRSVYNETGWFYLDQWTARGKSIRAGGTKDQCLANLTWALMNLGQANQAEYGGAAGALSLLPTAGALIGAPAAEMWIIFKLAPVAGVLSMFLSLGGTITPSSASDYDLQKGLSYGGMMASPASHNTAANVPASEEPVAVEASGMPGRAWSSGSQESTGSNAGPEKPARRSDRLLVEPRNWTGKSLVSEAECFAHRVYQRAQSHNGPDSYNVIWLGVFIQVILIMAILVVMYFAQLGGVVTWWCLSWGWMYFWYFLVVVTAIADNLTATPFSLMFKLRVCKAPIGVKISQGAASLLDETRAVLDVLDRIESGFSTRARIQVPELASSASTCFYVIISVESITALHAFLRAMTKGCTISVFAFGTTLFASAQLMSISAALMVLAVVLSAGVMARVTAMWMAAMMTRHSQPVLHAVVKSKAEASRYITEILRCPDLLIEFKDLVILDAKIIKQKNPWTSLSTYIGLLAGPEDLHRLARMQSHSGSRCRFLSRRRLFREPLRQDIEPGRGEEGFTD